MNITTETPAVGRLKKPTGKNYLFLYGGGIAGVLFLGLLASVLDWPRITFLVGACIWVALFVPIGVMALHGRRENPRPARS